VDRRRGGPQEMQVYPEISMKRKHLTSDILTCPDRSLKTHGLQGKSGNIDENKEDHGKIGPISEAQRAEFAPSRSCQIVRPLGRGKVRDEMDLPDTADSLRGYTHSRRRRCGGSGGGASFFSCAGGRSRMMMCDPPLGLGCKRGVKVMQRLTLGRLMPRAGCSAAGGA
jgi:hypothetical protein